MKVSDMNASLVSQDVTRYMEDIVENVLIARNLYSKVQVHS